MNFLAHFHLAWPDDGLVAGGLEGDYLKGPLPQGAPDPVLQGVVLHRAIDAYTDSHPALASLRNEFDPSLRRYAGILVDLSFDHFLSQHWDRFSDQPLTQFNSDIYRSLEAQRSQLSPSARRMLDRLVQYDILALYQDWETVPASATRVGERFRRGNPFVAIDAKLDSLRPSLEQAFLDFYPDLQAFVSRHRNTLN